MREKQDYVKRPPKNFYQVNTSAYKTLWLSAIAAFIIIFTWWKTSLVKTVKSPHLSFVKPNTHPFYLNSDRNSLIQQPAYNDYKGTHLVLPLLLSVACSSQ